MTSYLIVEKEQQQQQNSEKVEGTRVERIPMRNHFNCDGGWSKYRRVCATRPDDDHNDAVVIIDTYLVRQSVSHSQGA